MSVSNYVDIDTEESTIPQPALPDGNGKRGGVKCLNMELPEELHRQAKTAAAAMGITFKALVLNALREVSSKHSKAA